MLPRGEGWKLVSAVGLDCKFVPLPWLIIRYAPQLPDIFGNGSWLGRTGGYFQQLGGTMNFFPVHVGHRMYSMAAGNFPGTWNWKLSVALGRTVNLLPCPGGL